MPGDPDGIDHRTRGALDRSDPPSCRPLGRCLAGLRVLAVDEDGASGAETGTAPELRPAQAEHISEHPQKRRLGVAVVDFEVRVIHRELHWDPPRGGLLTGSDSL